MPLIQWRKRKRLKTHCVILSFQVSVYLKKNKKRYGEIVTRLSELSAQFSNNVLDATMGWEKVIEDESQLAGLPESALLAAKQSAESKGLKGYRFTLEIPSYLPIMTYCENAALREEMYRAYATRASDQGPNAGKWDNTAIIEEIMTLRVELAKLLGFNTLYLNAHLRPKWQKIHNKC